MKKQRLGKTGLMVSRIGLGGIPLTRPSEQEVVRIIQRAFDLGINFIDTAWGYDPSETRIGKALKAVGIPRRQVIITTKSGARDKATALKQLDMSLQRLQTDYIDLWQLHNVSTWEKYEKILGPGGSLKAAQEALTAGKIRHIGLSSHNVDVALKAIKTGLFEAVQFPLNFVSDEALAELVPLARKRDIGFIAMKPLAGGCITKAELAIKYLLQFDHVVPDPGIEKVAEIEEIAAIVDSGSWTLTGRERREIEAIRREVGPYFCRQCQYCMPCPQGVNVWMVMITKRMWQLWPKEIFFQWMAEIIESGRSCLQCGECEEKCPYHLPIRKMINEHIAFYDRMFLEHGELTIAE